MPYHNRTLKIRLQVKNMIFHEKRVYGSIHYGYVSIHTKWVLKKVKYRYIWGMGWYIMQMSLLIHIWSRLQLKVFFKQMALPSMYWYIVVVGRYITGMSRLSHVWSRLLLKNFFKQTFLPSMYWLLESMYRLARLMCWLIRIWSQYILFYST